jgi:hypothetical protein
MVLFKKNSKKTFELGNNVAGWYYDSEEVDKIIYIVTKEEALRIFNGLKNFMKVGKVYTAVDLI